MDGKLEPPLETGVDDVRPAAKRIGQPRFDVVASITALFISAVSLYVAIQHGRTERDLVAANVWPFPQALLSNGYDSRHSTAIGVSNAGVGPAKIRSFELFYRGQPVSSGLDLLRKCCGLGAGRDAVKAAFPNGTFNSIVDETVLRPGEVNIVLRVVPSTSAPQITDRLKQVSVLRQISFRVCYCSVLDQCWINDLQTLRANQVRECRPPEHPYDPNGP